MKVLFIGGTGTISTSCVALAVQRGLAVSVVNRCVSDRPELPAAVEALVARSKLARGLPAIYRTRTNPGPAPSVHTAVVIPKSLRLMVAVARNPIA